MTILNVLNSWENILFLNQIDRDLKFYFQRKPLIMEISIK